MKVANLTLLPRRRITDEAFLRVTIFHGRRFGPLLIVWMAALVVAGGLYWFQYTVPAMIDMLPPFYILLGIVVIISTWRWIRSRNQLQDRRHGDRRRARRRHPFRRERIEGNEE